MAIFKKVEMWFARLDPTRPNAKYNKKNPTWELQLRTTDPEQYKEWKEGHLNPKLIKYSDEHEDPNLAGTPILKDGKKQWRVNLRKNSLDQKGAPAKPVKVQDGGMNDIDPKTIGNGSVGNIMVFLREYVLEGEQRVAPILMGVQVTRYVKYTPTGNHEGFEMEETEVIEEDDSDDSSSPAQSKSPSPGKPSAPAASTNPEEEY